MELLSQYYKTQFLCTCGGPKLSLTLDDLSRNMQQRGFIVKNSHVSFFSNCPTHVHSKGGHCMLQFGVALQDSFLSNKT
jgi:hypothetical protein